MVKFLIVTAAGAVVILAVMFGPGIWTGLQFTRSAARVARVAQDEGGPWPQLIDECAICHGKHGDALSQAYPTLAGQPAAYVTNQLHAFATGARRSAAMGSLAASLSDSEIASVAAYYARQTPQANAAFASTGAGSGTGRALAEKYACASCHGTDLLGQDIRPRLAGQNYDYLVKQLTAFKSGARVDPTGTMNAMTTSLSADEITALAGYLAGAQVRRGIAKP